MRLIESLNRLARPISRFAVRVSALGWIIVTTSLFEPTMAQQVRLPSGYQVPVQSGVSGGAVDIPRTNLAPITAVPPSSVGPAAPGLAPFDPYATTPSQGYGGIGGSLSPSVIPAPGGATGFGSSMTSIGPPTAVAPYPPSGAIAPYPPAGAIAPSAPGGSLFSRVFSRPASSPNLNAPIYGAPGPGAMGTVPGNSNVYGPPPAYGTPPGSTYPGTIYPSNTPSTLFPSGAFQGGLISGGLFQNANPSYSAFRFLQGPRLRHAWVSGGDGSTDLGTNDTDVSVIFAFPNFLYSTQPLFVIPSFSLHLWDGPSVAGGADLPANAYSGFLDVGWYSDPNKMVSTEFGVRVGAFTDFNTFNNDSIRVLGKGIVNFRWTPASTLKLGVIYLDRNSIKLIPAGGILYQPSPASRYDLFFPQPKASHYWRTIGTRDVWWYLAGDYGGGSWTIQRTGGTDDSIDINEIRAVLGIEFGESNAIRAGRRTAFFEVGYAFDRELEYRFNPADNIKPADGFILRAGIGY